MAAKGVGMPLAAAGGNACICASSFFGTSFVRFFSLRLLRCVLDCTAPSAMQKKTPGTASILAVADELRYEQVTWSYTGMETPISLVRTRGWWEDVDHGTLTGLSYSP